MKKFRQNKKTIITVVVAVVIAVFISVCSCYVLAESLINSKDVVYEDNSNLAAENVQDAIDGTCSKIDTRLSDIEDKLYTVKNMASDVGFTSQTTNFYTGAYIEIPAKSYCGITVKMIWSMSTPAGAFLSSSPTELNNINRNYEGWKTETSYIVAINQYFNVGTTYYVWARYSGSSENRLEIKGYCATKYK